MSNSEEYVGGEVKFHFWRNSPNRFTLLCSIDQKKTSFRDLGKFHQPTSAITSLYLLQLHAEDQLTVT